MSAGSAHAQSVICSVPIHPQRIADRRQQPDRSGCRRTLAGSMTGQAKRSTSRIKDNSADDIREENKRLKKQLRERTAALKDALEQQDVVQHAESLQCAHSAEVHEVRRHRVARKLVAVDNEDLPPLTGQEQRQTATGGAAADDQRVVFRLRIQVLGHSGADLRMALWITRTNSLSTMWPRRRS